MAIPDDFSYKWEPVGAGFLCSFCPAQRTHLRLWRAHSDMYGDCYVCPRHLLVIRNTLGKEAQALYLAMRANRKRDD